MQIEKLKATGKDKIEKTYILKIKENKQKNNITYYIYENDIRGEDFFQFEAILENDKYRVKTMYAHENKYKGKGLPEAILEHFFNRYKKQVYSSKNSNVETRSSEATKMWSRLVKKNLAKFDKNIDRYITIF